MDEQLLWMLILSFFAGALLGLLFFGGLWWTVQKSVSSSNPALLFFASLLLRSSVTLAGFYFIALGDWRGLLTALVSFTLTRMIAARLATPTANSASVTMRGKHAS